MVDELPEGGKHERNVGAVRSGRVLVHSGRNGPGIGQRKSGDARPDRLDT